MFLMFWKTVIPGYLAKRTNCCKRDKIIKCQLCIEIEPNFQLLEAGRERINSKSYPALLPSCWEVCCNGWWMIMLQQTPWLMFKVRNGNEIIIVTRETLEISGWLLTLASRSTFPEWQSRQHISPKFGSEVRNEKSCCEQIFVYRAVMGSQESYLLFHEIWQMAFSLASKWKNNYFLVSMFWLLGCQSWKVFFILVCKFLAKLLVIALAPNLSHPIVNHYPAVIAPMIQEWIF